MNEYIEELKQSLAFDDFVVYMMVGIPGSGKSTWIENNIDDSTPIVSRDIIRENLGYCSNGEKIVGTKQQEKKVTEVENALIEKYCKKHQTFVIDDTNTGKYRAGLIQKLHAFGALVIGVNMKTPLDVCIQRRKGQISPDIMRDIYKRSIPLSDSEVDKVINVKY